jgi:hypothetical protein
MGFSRILQSGCQREQILGHLPMPGFQTTPFRWCQIIRQAPVGQLLESGGDLLESLFQVAEAGGTRRFLGRSDRRQRVAQQLPPI